LKKDIHPEYKEAVFSCACGNSIHTRSTVGDIKFDICSNCHPFYTGKQKLVDSAGRVDKYIRRYGKTSEAKSARKEKTEKDS
jgi:large subunit ribosomal protein L31